jgi:hypothetical protein
MGCSTIIACCARAIGNAGWHDPEDIYVMAMNGGCHQNCSTRVETKSRYGTCVSPKLRDNNFGSEILDDYLHTFNETVITIGNSSIEDLTFPFT